MLNSGMLLNITGLNSPSLVSLNNASGGALAGIIFSAVGLVFLYLFTKVWGVIQKLLCLILIGGLAVAIYYLQKIQQDIKNLEG